MSLLGVQHFETNQTGEEVVAAVVAVMPLQSQMMLMQLSSGTWWLCQKQN